MAGESPFVKGIKGVALGNVLAPGLEALAFDPAHFALTPDPAGSYDEPGGRHFDGANVVSLNSTAPTFPGAAIHRFLFAAGTAYTAAAQALAANPALAAETTLIDVGGKTTASGSWAPPAGARGGYVIRHTLAAFSTGSINAPTWELTTLGATLFPGYDFDLLSPSFAADSFPSGVGPGVLPIADLSDMIIGGSTVTVTFTASPLVAITSGAGAVVVRYVK